MDTVNNEFSCVQMKIGAWHLPTAALPGTPRSEVILHSQLPWPEETSAEQGWKLEETEASPTDSALWRKPFSLVSAEENLGHLGGTISPPSLMLYPSQPSWRAPRTRTAWLVKPSRCFNTKYPECPDVPTGVDATEDSKMGQPPPTKSFQGRGTSSLRWFQMRV